MKFRDRVVHITVEEIDRHGNITGTRVEKVEFGRLTDRAKVMVICHTLGLPYPEPPARSNRRHTPCLFVGERRLMFDDKHEIKGIIDYQQRPWPQWADRGSE